MEFSGPYADAYAVVISNTSATTWSGEVLDLTTGSTAAHIGSWTVPDGSGGIAGSQLGFVEYFAPENCSTDPFTSVTFGVPIMLSGGTGSLSDASHTGNCVGVVPYESHRNDDGSVEISVGFNQTTS